jgi:hypothetical protein
MTQIEKANGTMLPEAKGKKRRPSLPSACCVLLAVWQSVKSAQSADKFL